MKTIFDDIVDSLHEYFVVYPSYPKLNTCFDRRVVQKNLMFNIEFEEFKKSIIKPRFEKHIPEISLLKPWNKELAERVKQIKHNHRRK